MSTLPPELVEAHRAFRDELVKARLLIPMGVDGLYGRSGDFERIVEGINHAFSTVGDPDRPDVMRFPPGIGRLQLEQSGYLKSSPQLVGTIHSFNGSDSDHRAMLDTLDKGGDGRADLVLDAGNGVRAVRLGAGDRRVPARQRPRDSRRRARVVERRHYRGHRR